MPVHARRHGAEAWEVAHRDHRSAVAEQHAGRGEKPLSAGRHFLEVDATADRAAVGAEEDAGAGRADGGSGCGDAEGRPCRDCEAAERQAAALYLLVQAAGEDLSASNELQEGARREGRDHRSAREHHPGAEGLTKLGSWVVGSLGRGVAGELAPSYETTQLPSYFLLGRIIHVMLT